MKVNSYFWAVRNLGALFMLFIVLISLLPCTDEVENNGVPTAISFQVTHGDDETAENCSSICMCACCGQRIVAIEQSQFHIQKPIQFPNHTIKNYQFFLEQLDSNIWQPPKIA